MAEEQVGRVVRVAGPLVVAAGLPDPRMYDLVRVGEERLMGEVIELRTDLASIQVYEETLGIGPGDPVFPTGGALSVELGPGLLESIYDGVQRPLDVIRESSGNFIIRGTDVPAWPETGSGSSPPFSRRGSKSLKEMSWGPSRKPRLSSIA